MASDPLLLTVREACDRLRVGKTTFYKLIAAGQVRTVAVGPQTVRVALVDLEAYVRRLRGEPEPA